MMRHDSLEDLVTAIAKQAHKECGLYYEVYLEKYESLIAEHSLKFTGEELQQFNRLAERYK